MNLLVFNCGSSSLNCKVYAVEADGRITELLRGKASRVGVTSDRPSSLELTQAGVRTSREVRMDNHRHAASFVLDELAARGLDVQAIGHRWPHGCGRFDTALVDGPLLRQLRELVPLNPLHHPATLRVIEACRRRLPSIPQYVTTDTAFHATLPLEASQYLLPRELIEEHGFRKYGFHGLSFQWVTRKVRGELGARRGGERIVICHLGTGGSEIDAVQGGRSVDVSMGYTGNTGVMMSTRCGDIDPLLPAWIAQAYDAPLDDVGRMLHAHSGLLGITEATSDIRDVLERCQRGGDPQSELALAMYVRSVRRYIGEFVAVLQGLDALVFTDDIGCASWPLREKVCAGMEWCGIHLDPDLNRQTTGDTVARIESAESLIDIMVVPTDEEEVIAREAFHVLAGERVCG